MNKSTPVNMPATSSSRRRQENSDPFDDLLTDPGPSKPLFTRIIPTDRPENQVEPSTPQSTGSDFGAFVSVPASSENVEHPLIDLESDEEPQPMKSSPMTGFFDRFTEGAKHRANQNERRVLDELLKHEDDPLYWIQPPKETEDMEGSISDALNSPIPRKTDSPPSLRRSFDVQRSDPPASESPPSADLPRQTSAPAMPSSYSGTFPRRWMSNLLHTNTMPAISGSKLEAATSPSQRKTVLPEVTHSSPFASHIFVPPSGAPGFTGDYHWNKSGFEFEEQDKRLGKLSLVGRKELTTPVLTNNLADQLRSNLPALPRLSKTWSLLYSLDQHGVSLQTLYSRCLAAKVMGTIIVIRDAEERVFGVWLGEHLRMVPGAYYGSGESFLWTTVLSDGQQRVRIFKWTGKNEYVALCDTNYISFGGGDGKYGLYLDATLTDGSSAPCPTFNNPPLCSSLGENENKNVDFECVGIEVWGVNS